MIEAIAIFSSILALIVSVVALHLDRVILREMHPHHKMVKELHQHHLGHHKIVNDVGHDTGLHVEQSDQPDHEDCHGPVYRRYDCDPNGGC